MPFVIESVAYQDGRRAGMFRHYVETEERAKEEASKAPGRTYRYVSLEEMPAAAKENLERAIQERI